MLKLLPAPLRTSISRSRNLPTTDQLKRLQQLLVLMPEAPAEVLWHQLPWGDELAALAWRRPADAKGPLCTHLPEAGRPAVTIGFLKPAATLFAWQSEARKLADAALAEDPETVGVIALGWDDDQKKTLQATALAALLAATFRLPELKSKRKRKPRLRRIRVFAPAAGLDLVRVRAEAEGNNLARWLTALPPNQLDAKGYRKLAMALAEREGWRARFLDEKSLARRGAGAFLAVSQGNASRDAGILHLRYRPAKVSARPRVALVGKGICFDTGGSNLKPFKGMLDMHEDMQGSAVALGTLLALTRVRYPHPVDCWLAVTENRISATAYKSRDVVTACNGVTIEVIHTDAEGRMVLADTLALAAGEHPGMILDFATLTGACVQALTTRYSGVFSNRPSLYPDLVSAGEASGERVWGFPMDKDFDEELDSAAADIAQCAVSNDGDHILAARFLGRFVPEEIPWIHMDLAASHRKGGLGLVSTGPTGFGVRYTVQLLLDQQLDLKRES